MRGSRMSAILHHSDPTSEKIIGRRDVYYSVCPHTGSSSSHPTFFRLKKLPNRCHFSDRIEGIENPNPSVIRTFFYPYIFPHHRYRSL